MGPLILLKFLTKSLLSPELKAHVLLVLGYVVCHSSSAKKTFINGGYCQLGVSCQEFCLYYTLLEGVPLLQHNSQYFFLPNVEDKGLA